VVDRSSLWSDTDARQLFENVVSSTTSMNAHPIALLAAISIAATLACSSSTNEPTGAGTGGVSGAGNSGSGGAGGNAGATEAGGGSGANGDATADAVADGSDDCGCVADAITWGNNGGRVAYVDRSTLSPCDTFSHQRDPASTDPPTLMCSQGLGTCTSTVSAREINVALEQPDVRAALAAAPILFGRDTRPVDGVVFRITVGAAVIEIGEACNGIAGCREIPQTVAALGIRLRALTNQELARGACRDTFGPG
jgi:hypothetical protein